MNFTREPIIETIITPKDGYKLVVRNSKGDSQEEYHVDAVEVVSFGHSFFFRSLERPKSFLVPVSDYEVIETKEMRVVLKNVNIERAIKIGGGRQVQPQPQREVVEEAPVQEEEAAAEVTAEAATMPPAKIDRKRDRRRNRRGRRSPEERQPSMEAPKDAERAAEPAAQGGGPDDETQVSSSMFTSLFPPPPTLISETIGRYKEAEFLTRDKKKDDQPVEGDFSSEPVASPEPLAAEPPPVEDRKRRKKESPAHEPIHEPAHVEQGPKDEDDYFMI